MINLDDVEYGLGTNPKHFNPKIIDYALDHDVKLIDCASIYPSQKNIIGPVIRQRRSTNRFARNKVFIISKLWPNQLGKIRKFNYELCKSIEDNCKKTLKELSIKKLDALLIHWPLNVEEDTGITEEFIIEEVWPQMERLVNEGLVRYIGVSNFGLIELHKLLNVCKIRPYINQLEINPYQPNKVVTKFCIKNNIKVIASSPFAFDWKEPHLKLFEEDVLKQIAKKHKTTPANVVMKWLINKQIIPIPGTSDPVHWNEYTKLGDVNLTCEDVTKIEKLDENKRLYTDNMFKKHHLEYWPKYSFQTYEALTGTEDNPELKPVSTDNINFLEKCKESLTTGPGYLVLRKIFNDQLNIINLNIGDQLADKNLSRHEITSSKFQDDIILNRHPIYAELMNNNILALIVESLLGWDCLVDNCGVSISRPGGDVFGPHQDSPFEQNPGASLPHHLSPVVLQAIFCIDGFTKDNGGLFVIPYSHKCRERKRMMYTVIPETAVTLETEPGDVILALGNIWHGANKNKTTQDRRAFLCEFINSIVKPWKEFDASNIHTNIYKNFSKRLVRLFNNREEEKLLTPWKEHQFN